MVADWLGAAGTEQALGRTLQPVRSGGASEGEAGGSRKEKARSKAEEATVHRG